MFFFTTFQEINTAKNLSPPKHAHPPSLMDGPPLYTFFSTSGVALLFAGHIPAVTGLYVYMWCYPSLLFYLYLDIFFVYFFVIVYFCIILFCLHSQLSLVGRLLSPSLSLSLPPTQLLLSPCCFSIKCCNILMNSVWFGVN